MNTDFSNKSTIDEIRKRFDSDVERFSNLDTGQSSTIDAPLSMELITQAAIAATKPIRKILDIGCGAGNNTIKLLKTSGLNPDCDILDLSQNMLDRAKKRISEIITSKITQFCGDFRTVELEKNSYDVIIAAAVLHHLRDDADWHCAFEKIYSLLRVGGSVWISDFVSHENNGVQELMYAQYGEYLKNLGGTEYRDKVFAYIEKEDSPRSTTYQIELLKNVGFKQTEILHKNSCFAAFGAIK